MDLIKLLRPEEWASFQASGQFTGSADDLRDGYIHLSTPEQAPATAAKWFADVEGLMEIHIDARTLGDELKWEASRGGQLFPHYYSVLNLHHVVTARPYGTL
jgi:uncharacterized protein (DUF952 family)